MDHDPFSEGEAAYHNGFVDNPYEPGTHNYREWEAGYDEAEEEGDD